MINRAIVAVSVIGCLWLISTAGTWGEIVDSIECSAPKAPKRVTL